MNNGVYQGEPVFDLDQERNHLVRTAIYQPEQSQEPLGTSFADTGEPVGPLGPLVPVLALTTGQRFVFAVIGLVAVVVFVVLPAVYGTRWDRRRDYDNQSRRRLLKELRKHE